MRDAAVTREVPPLAFKPAEAARRLGGISERFLIELRDSGEIPCVRRGRLVLFLDSDLHAWLQKHRTPSAVA